MLHKLKTVCERFEKDNEIKVKVCPRAGRSVKTDAKAEPLRKLGCDREDCLPCRWPGKTKAGCEKNSVTYKITSQTCLLPEKKTSYEGETGRNAITCGLEYKQGFHSKSEKSGAICRKAEEVAWWMEPLGSFLRVFNVLPAEKIEGPPRDFLKANTRPHPRPHQRPKTRGAAGPEGFEPVVWLRMWPRVHL